jgi:hypothetical protein
MGERKFTLVDHIPNESETAAHPSGFFTLTKDVIVYKKAYYWKSQFAYHMSNCTIKLLLPAGTNIYVTENKCRADSAKVLQINKSGSAKTLTIAISHYDCNFRYEVGQIAKPNKFSTHTEKCAGGIHFFRTLKEARAY